MGYVLFTWPFLGALVHGPSWACPAFSGSCTLVSPLGRLGCPHIYLGPHPRTCLIGPSIFVCLGAHRPCALCFRALCPGIAPINTPAPNSMQKTNESMRGHKQGDKTCTHQTTRGTNESLNLGPSLLFGSLLVLVPLWPILLSSQAMDTRVERSNTGIQRKFSLHVQ